MIKFDNKNVVINEQKYTIRLIVIYYLIYCATNMEVKT